jgi:hypothetical protein
LGIGTNTPSSYSYLTSAITAAIGNTSANGQLSILSSTTGAGAIAFADGTSGGERFAGEIRYDHAANEMYFRTNNNINGFIASNGRWLIGSVVTPSNTLDVNGTARIRNGAFIASDSGNVVIGSTTDAGFRLDVNGTARVQGTATITGSTTAASAIARGANLTSTLVAAANNDVLVGLDVNPTFTNGAFTGLDNQALRVTGTSASARGNTFGVGAAIATFRNNTTSTGFDPVYIVKFTRQNSATASWYFGNDANNNGVIATNNSSLRIGKDTSGTYTEHLRIFPSTGNIVLQNGGTFTDAGYRLDVSGSARITNGLTLTGSATISNILTLTPQTPLPSGVATGSFAVSSSAPPKPYFYDGTSWNALY